MNQNQIKIMFVRGKKLNKIILIDNILNGRK